MSTGGRRRRAPITLSEEDGVRYLHFGTRWIQGGMRLARPFALVLEYQQRMLLPALFVPAPARIVQLGLGAGALAKFCWKHLAPASVQAVELDAGVMAAARQWFALPPDDARLTVTEGDAGVLIGDRRQVPKADWLQIDLYDRAARGPVLDDALFYSACRRALRSPGVACVNLFGSRFDDSFAAWSAGFDGRVLALPPVDAGNRIALGFAGPRLEVERAGLEQRARELRALWKLPFDRWLDELWEANALPSRTRL